MNRYFLGNSRIHKDSDFYPATEREALQSELEEARTDGNMTAMVGELERQVGNLKIDKQQILLGNNGVDLVVQNSIF